MPDWPGATVRGDQEWDGVVRPEWGGGGGIPSPGWARRGELPMNTSPERLELEAWLRDRWFTEACIKDITDASDNIMELILARAEDLGEVVAHWKSFPRSRFF